MNQKIPKYSKSELDHILERDFPDGTADEAMKVLQVYGKESWQQCSLRVHMACLKLANGDMANLQKYVLAAYADPRDVISWAEYGAYMRANSEEAKQKAIDEDWKELQEWLRRK